MDVHVTRHGNRWAVREGPDATPLSEYPTREQAELAARQIAEERGAQVFVSEVPEGAEPAAASEPSGDEPEPRPRTEGGATDPSDRVTSRQAGL
jgi:Uncharacterized protein conserved in bacteria (DUF2188)